MGVTPKKELILINPGVSHSLIRIFFQFAFKKYIPFSLLTLLALTPKEYRTRVFNQKFFWFKQDFLKAKGALVGITAVTSSVDEAYKLADCYRRAGAYVVMGGPHVSALPQEALQHADSVVVGEAESAWHQLLSDFENSALKKIYTGLPVKDFFSLSYPYLLDLNPSLLYLSGLFVSRGCKYSCDFCARPKQQLRFVKIEQIVQLIKKMKGVYKIPFLSSQIIYFRDDNIFQTLLMQKNYSKGLSL